MFVKSPQQVLLKWSIGASRKEPLSIEFLQQSIAGKSSKKIGTIRLSQKLCLLKVLLHLEASNVLDSNANVALEF